MSSARGSGWGAWAAVLAIVAAATHLLAETRGYETAAIVAKPIPVLLLAIAVALAGRSRLRAPLVAGLLASAAGDVLIQRPDGFLAGLAAFLVAHVLYAAGFWRTRAELLPLRAVPFALFGLLVTWRLAPGLESSGAAFGAAVGAYIAAICVMMWRAAALVGTPGLAARVGQLATGGAILFAASDSLIAVNRFVTPLAWANVPIMLLYWAGQCGIAGAAIALASPKERM